jgi:hypothetical protein
MLKPVRWLLRLTIILTIGVFLADWGYTHLRPIADAFPVGAPSNQSIPQLAWNAVMVIIEQIKNIINH